jgi:hypothetical protein
LVGRLLLFSLIKHDSFICPIHFFKDVRQIIKAGTAKPGKNSVDMMLSFIAFKSTVLASTPAGQV